MKTKCTQVPFEFHGLFQCKAKARFDGGRILIWAVGAVYDRTLLIRAVIDRPVSDCRPCVRPYSFGTQAPGAHSNLESDSHCRRGL